MSYEDIAQMTDYVARHRSGNSPFELVVGYNDAEARSVEDLEGIGAS